MAPFTGGYFKYIGRVGDAPGFLSVSFQILYLYLCMMTFYLSDRIGCCRKRIELTPYEEEENWKIIPHPKEPEYEIKARVVLNTITYGTVRNKGDLRWYVIECEMDH